MRLESFRGSLLGLAIGDALGTTLEIKKPRTFEPITDMIGGGPFGLKPGQWTDDTSMALCLAESLTECGTFDPRDQMDRYVRWFRDGYLSSTEQCFDIGRTVRNALVTFEQSGNPFSGSTDPFTAGNGSLMRLASVPLFYADNPEQAIHFSGESSRTTHGTREAIDACRHFSGLIVGVLQMRPKDEILSPVFATVSGLWKREPLAPKIVEIASGSFKHNEPPEIVGSGYVVHCLEAALWAFHKSKDFRTGALLAVNLGDDADSTGAVYGQLAGAFYGEGGIPEDWKNKLAKLDLILSLAGKLHSNAQS